MPMGFSFGMMKYFATRQRWQLHSIGKAPNATELFMLIKIKS